MPFAVIIGSLLCPGACPDLCLVYIGTDQVWHLIENGFNAFTRLQKNNFSLIKEDIDEDKKTV